MKAGFVPEEKLPAEQVRLELPAAYLAPTTEDEANIIRFALVPVARCRVSDINFDFDSSFLRPDAMEDFQQLSLLMKQYPGAPLSVFGHADPAGKDEYNKKLSGRRARAVYAVLLRDTEIWEDLYNNPQGEDEWGTLRVQELLASLQYDPGPLDGVKGELTENAVREFQEEFGLTVGGKPGRNTRRKLFEIYMDMLCIDYRGQPYRLEKSQFLAQGQDKDGKGDYQGCGEHNPELVFSQHEAKELEQDRERRNRENEPNRRVVIFLFRPGSVILPERWPCPTANEGVAKCKKRFWSDGDHRRSNQEQRRKYENTKDTFACRFYDRIMHSSKELGVVVPAVSEFYGRPTGFGDDSEKPHRLMVPQGVPVTLFWKQFGAKEIRIEAMTLDGKISEWHCSQNNSNIGNLAQGEIIVTPLASSVYTLFASNQTGTTRYIRQVHVFRYEAIQPSVYTTRYKADYMEMFPMKS